MSSSSRWCLQCYSVCLGCCLSFAAFLWMALVLFALSRTDPKAEDLMMARYLECCFGLLAFTSALALIYGAFVESRTWLSVFSLGSATVLIGYWSWFFYRKYGPWRDPESLRQTQVASAAATAAFALAAAPVVRLYRRIDPQFADLFKRCRRAGDACYTASSSPIAGSASPSPSSDYFDKRKRRRNGESKGGSKLVVIGGSYVKQFYIRETHYVQNSKMPKSKDEDLYNPV